MTLSGLFPKKREAELAPISRSVLGRMPIGGLPNRQPASNPLEAPMSDRDLFNPDEWQCIVERLSLTRRQSELLRALIAGRTDRQMAQELGISPNTVRAHFQRIFESLGVPDRTRLVVAAFRAFREQQLDDYCVADSFVDRNAMRS